MPAEKLFPGAALVALILGASLATGGCSLKPYKIDIQQGNVVTQDMVSKLRPGMTRAQVRFVMGTPLVTDAFHPARWDYYYRFDKGGRAREQRVLTLQFDGDKLARVDGDVNVAPGLEAAGAAGK